MPKLFDMPSPLVGIYYSFNIYAGLPWLTVGLDGHGLGETAGTPQRIVGHLYHALLAWLDRRGRELRSGAAAFGGGVHYHQRLVARIGELELMRHHAFGLGDGAEIVSGFGKRDRGGTLFLGLGLLSGHYQHNGQQHPICYPFHLLFIC